MPTTGNIRYEFGELEMGTASLSNCAAEFDGIRASWMKEVNELGMGAWLDAAGSAFQGISGVWDHGANLCTQFQNDIARAVAACQANGEQALADCQQIVNR